MPADGRIPGIDEPLTLLVLYSCKLCGLRRIKVLVPVRQTDEDIMDWLNATVLLLAQDHDRKQPTCHPQTLTDVMIPLPPDQNMDRLGGPVIQ